MPFAAAGCECNVSITTLLYLGFFAAVAVLNYALPRVARPYFLLIASYAFFCYTPENRALVPVLLGATVVTWACGLAIGNSKNKVVRVLFLLAAIFTALGILLFYKYWDLFDLGIVNLAGLFGQKVEPYSFNLVAPLGLSYFTFASLSYTIDVYRRRIEPLDRIIDYAFFVSFFPQLVAGPIVRAKDFIPQIRRPLTVTREMLGTGVYFIVCGLFKKVVIGDYISINFVDRIFDNPALYSGLENLVGLYGYALQIYCDFSGYSDMAIGIALLLGFHFNINFDSPYKSASITEFWRRWHISLSSWLKDYLYISLGGNRKGKIRQYINLILTMFLGGLWHGASWNFVLWGLLHGVALALHKVWMAITGQKIGQKHGFWTQTLCVVLTFHFVCLCWIFFRNVDFDNSMAMLRQIGTSFHIELLPQLVEGYWKVLLVMAIGFMLHFLPTSWETAAKRMMVKMPVIGYWLVLVLVIYLAIQMKSSEIQPFIYFQF